ncbi:MAG: DUF533 domain-containing protein [Rhizobiaceae bacterium]
MNASKRIIVGTALVAAGAGALYLAYSGNRYALGFAGWAAILTGAVLLMNGLSALYAQKHVAPAPQPVSLARTDINLLVRAMASMARADGRIEQREISTIVDICELMLGPTIKPSEIRTLVTSSASEDMAASLERQRDQLDAMARALIFRSCHLVMIADLEIAGVEDQRLHAIGKALGFSQSEMEAMIAQAGT